MILVVSELLRSDPVFLRSYSVRAPGGKLPLAVAGVGGARSLSLDWGLVKAGRNPRLWVGVVRVSLVFQSVLFGSC